MDTENDRSKFLKQEIEDLKRDAARWRAIQHVFHIHEPQGAMVRISTNWSAWVHGLHFSATDAIDAYSKQNRS